VYCTLYVYFILAVEKATGVKNVPGV